MTWKEPQVQELNPDQAVIMAFSLCLFTIISVLVIEMYKFLVKNNFSKHIYSVTRSNMIAVQTVHVDGHFLLH